MGNPIPAEALAAIDDALRAGGFTKVVARAHGVSVYWIAKRRAALGIAPAKPGDNAKRDGGPNAIGRGTSGKRNAALREALPAALANRELVKDVAEKFGVCVATVGKYRREQGLSRPPRPAKRAVRPLPPVQAPHVSAMRDPLFRRVWGALASVRINEYRLEVAHEMYCDLLLGEMDERRITASATRYIARSMPSRFGTLSLNDLVGDDGKATFLDYVEDQSASLAMELSHMRAVASRAGVQFQEA